MMYNWLILVFYFYWGAGFLFGEIGMAGFGLAHLLAFALLIWLYRQRLTFWRIVEFFLLAYVICGLPFFLGLKLLLDI